MTYSQPVFAEPDALTLDAQLYAVLSQAELPAELKAKAKRLHARLTRPIQVVVLGAKNSGKSAMLDVLLGQRVGGGCSGLPMVEMVYGPNPLVSFETETGLGKAKQGHISDHQPPRGAICGRQQLPHPLLREVSFTEVRLAGGVEQQGTILRHAVKFADVILWCSADFDPVEEQLWAIHGAQKSGSSFLVLTKADQQVMRASLPQTIKRLAPTVSEQFIGLYPLAAEQALQARDRENNQSLWRSSGGKRLSEDLRRRIAEGRRAAQDQAEAFLWQIGFANTPTHTKPQAIKTLHSEAAAPQAVEDGVTHSQNASNQAQPVLQQALGRLQQQAEEMLEQSGETPETTAVLDQCLVAVRDLAETLLASPVQDPKLLAAQEASQEGEEMLMLLQLEQNEDAAVDAVTLLLQLKKELAEPPQASPLNQGGCA